MDSALQKTKETDNINKLKSCLFTQITTTYFLVEAIRTASPILLQLHLTQEFWWCLEPTTFCSKGDLEGFPVLPTSSWDLEDKVVLRKQIASALPYGCHMSLYRLRKLQGVREDGAQHTAKIPASTSTPWYCWHVEAEPMMTTHTTRLKAIRFHMNHL